MIEVEEAVAKAFDIVTRLFWYPKAFEEVVGNALSSLDVTT